MQNNPEIICRPLNLKDDLKQVARLIYFTDDYVFPHLYNNDINVATAVIPNMIKRDTIYNYKNITVAVCDDKIAGIVVCKKSPIKMNLNEMCGCFLDSGVVLDERFAKVYNEYYKLLDDEPNGIYIANVCVDKLYRRMGIAKKLLTFVLKDNETYNLESVKANAAAVNLYLSLGFQIEAEYPGFTGVPCYRMKRNAR